MTLNAGLPALACGLHMLKIGLHMLTKNEAPGRGASTVNQRPLGGPLTG